MSNVGGTHLCCVREGQLLTPQCGAMEQGQPEQPDPLCKEVPPEGDAGRLCPDRNVRLGAGDDSDTLWHSQVRGMGTEGFASSVSTYPKCQVWSSLEATLSP